MFRMHSPALGDPTWQQPVQGVSTYHFKANCYSMCFIKRAVLAVKAQILRETEEGCVYTRIVTCDMAEILDLTDFLVNCSLVVPNKVSRLIRQAFLFVSNDTALVTVN